MAEVWWVGGRVGGWNNWRLVVEVVEVTEKGKEGDWTGRDWTGQRRGPAAKIARRSPRRSRLSQPWESVRPPARTPPRLPATRLSQLNASTGFGLGFTRLTPLHASFLDNTSNTIPSYDRDARQRGCLILRPTAWKCWPDTCSPV